MRHNASKWEMMNNLNKGHCFHFIMASLQDFLCPLRLKPP